MTFDPPFSPDLHVRYRPQTFGRVPEKVLTSAEMKTIEMAEAFGMRSVEGVSAADRARMKVLLVEHVKAGAYGMKQGTHRALASALFAEFAVLNLDFEEIAATEMGEARNQGMIAAQELGAHVRWRDAYDGCPSCQALNGKTFRVVAPDSPDRNARTDVWVGKSNIGRVPGPGHGPDDDGYDQAWAQPHWFPAAGLQHVGCRGAWSAIPKDDPRVSPEFMDWMDNILRKHGIKPTNPRKIEE